MQLHFLDPPHADHVDPPSPVSTPWDKRKSSVAARCLRLVVMCGGQRRGWENWGCFSSPLKSRDQLPRSGEEGGVLLTAAYLGFPDGELCSVDSFLLRLRDRGTMLSVDSLEPDTGQQITYRSFERWTSRTFSAWKMCLVQNFGQVAHGKTNIYWIVKRCWI